MARRSLLSAGLPLALLAFPTTLLAEADFSGFWNLDMAAVQADPAMIARLPANTVVIEDTGIVEFPEGEYGGLRMTAEAKARAEAWTPADEFALDRVCLPPSIVYAIQGPFPFEVFQTPQLIVFKYEYFDQVRLIFMDGRRAPEDQPHSKMGFSTGRWEGDELVVETTHLLPSTITNNGLDHSDKLRMVERYKLDAGGNRLMATQWFTDPEMLENNGARFIAWNKQEGQHVLPYECDPSFALEYQQAAQAGE